MSTLFERNLSVEEMEDPVSKFDEILKDKQDILSIPMERIVEYFSDFGVEVTSLDEEEHHAQTIDDIQSWSIIAEMASYDVKMMEDIQDDLDLSNYVESSEIDSGKLNIIFSEEVEID